MRVIRIIRLARLGKLAKGEGMRENMAIMGETLSDSMNTSGTLLGALLFMEVVVFSSLCFVCEKGVAYIGCPTNAVTKTGCQNHTDTRFPGRQNCIWMNDKCKGLYFRPSFEMEPGGTPFRSIPETMWWTMTTITTVGYGDIYPKEPFGKLVGTFTQVTGLLVIAVVVTIIAGNFEAAHSQMKIKKKNDRLMYIDKLAEWKQRVLDKADGVPSQLIRIHSRQSSDSAGYPRTFPELFQDSRTAEVEIFPQLEMEKMRSTGETDEPTQADRPEVVSFKLAA